MRHAMRWVGVVLGAVLAACAVMLVVYGVTHREVPGYGLIVLLGPVVGIPAVFCAPGLFGAPLRRTRRAVAAVLFVAALPLGWAAAGAVASTSPARALWRAPADLPQSARTVAAWQDGDLLVRARQDGIDAYRAADGTLAWSLPARAREQLCAVGRDPVDGVVVVAYGRYQGPCEQLTAVRLGTGRELWRRAVPAADALAATGPVVVAAAPGGLSAFALADGADAWSVPATEGCAVRRLAGSPARAVAAEYCGAAGGAGQTWLRAVGPDGRPSWRTDLGAESDPEELRVLAADPPTVQVKESDPRGLDAVLALGPDGAPRATLPTALPDLRLKGLEVGSSYALAPFRQVVVTGDLLITTAVPANGLFADRVVAFSLVDGARRWTHRIDPTDDVIALDGSGGGLLAAVKAGTGKSRSYLLLELDPATGSGLNEQEVAESLGPDVRPVVAGDRFLVLHADGTGRHRPVEAFPRR